MHTLHQKITGRQPGIVTYGMTPPKITNTPDKLAEIAQKQVERLKGLPLDALLLYDIQEEADRVEQERPFPFLSAVDPSLYGNTYLKQLDVPKIIYRCAGKYSEAELSAWIKDGPGEEKYAVYVGASSGKQAVRLRLSEAYELSRRLNKFLTYGGVVIPERHAKHGDEHLRIVSKKNDGCAFFVSQATYHLEATKNLLSDYYYYCRDKQLEMVPILFNFAPCGSVKTLEFMKWLGISIPKWLENELVHSHDILDKSVQLSRAIYEELLDFGLDKGIPVGCSVESVSTRKVEIEASVELLKQLKAATEVRLKAAGE